MALVSLWQHIAADLRPIGMVMSKYNLPCHFIPKKFQSLGSTWICLYALFRSHFIRAQPAPFSLTSCVKASTDGYLRPVASPRYESLGILSFTDPPGGKLKSMITRRSSLSRFSVVFNGETTIGDRNGFVLNGPNRVPSPSSLVMYLLIWSRNSWAPLWFLTDSRSRFLPSVMPMGHPYLQNVTTFFYLDNQQAGSACTQCSTWIW